MSTDRSLFLPNEETLRRPDYTVALVKRIDELMTQRLLTDAERAEQYGIWSLLTSGSVNAGDIRLALQSYRNVAPIGDDGMWLQPIRDDQHLAWGRLEELVAGNEVTTDLSREPDSGGAEPTSPFERHALQWVREVMRTLDSLSSGNMAPSIYHIADLIPGQLVQRVRSEAAFEWFASPYSVGEAMMSLPTPGCRSFGIDGQGVFVLDAFAKALLNEITTYGEVEDGEQKARALSNVFMWGMLLKGLVYAMLETYMGTNLPAYLVKHGDVVENIDLALRTGSALLKLAKESDEEIKPRWGGALGAESSTASAETLIGRLRERIEHERQESLRPRL